MIRSGRERTECQRMTLRDRLAELAGEYIREGRSPLRRGPHGVGHVREKRRQRSASFDAHAPGKPPLLMSCSAHGPTQPNRSRWAEGIGSEAIRSTSVGGSIISSPRRTRTNSRSLSRKATSLLAARSCPSRQSARSGWLRGAMSPQPTGEGPVAHSGTAREWIASRRPTPRCRRPHHTPPE